MSWIKTASKCALAAGAILLSAGCTSKKDVAIAAKDETIRRQESSIADAERRRADEAARAAEAAKLNEQLAAQNAEMERKHRESLANYTNETNKNFAELQRQMSGLDKKFIVTNSPQPVDNGQMGNMYVDKKTGSIHIQVAGSVLFDPGRAELKPTCADTLMRIARTVKSQYPNNAVRIEGHTDSTPVVHTKERFRDNMGLSQARAASVYEFMAKRGGMSPSHMYTAGYGDRQPLVSPERTAADRAKNRRVEIVILPNNLKVQKERLAKNDTPAKPFQAAVQTSQK